MKKAYYLWDKIPVELTPFGSSGGNLVLDGKGWRISYQDFEEGGRILVLEDIAEKVTGDTRRDVETALYYDEHWFILWGDHRKEYEKAFPKGLKACIAVYKKL